MNRSKKFVLFLSMAVMLFYIANWTSTAGASKQESAMLNSEEGEIRSIINAYFEIRYRAFNTLQLEGFGDLISDRPEAVAFLDAELDKLAVEIKHAELNRLRYVDYEFFLDFKDISTDDTTQTATVSVRHDVIYQLSVELDPVNPIVSHAYNLDHTILLRQEQGQWKITSDNYTDYLWRMLRQTGISTDELLRDMKASPLPVLRNSSLQAEFSCNLPADVSTHPYDRQGAVDYALAHIRRADYNPNYPDYNGDPNQPWGDCTNFISQAFYEGGGVSMAVCGEPNSNPYCAEGPGGNLGWLYIHENFRASAWSDVGKLHEFILDPIATQSAGWPEGPEGCEVSIDQLAPGDVIQYKWDTDEIWDHAVIVVDTIGGIPYVASHSDDAGPVPYTGSEYFSNFEAIRYIHIERSDGNAPVTSTPTATPSPIATATFTPIPVTPTATLITGVLTCNTVAAGVTCANHGSYLDYNININVTGLTGGATAYNIPIGTYKRSTSGGYMGMMSDFVHSETSYYSQNSVFSMVRIQPFDAARVDYASFTSGAGTYVQVTNSVNDWRFIGGTGNYPNTLSVRGDVNWPITGYSIVGHIYLYSNQNFVIVSTPTVTPTGATETALPPTPCSNSCRWGNQCSANSQPASAKVASLAQGYVSIIGNLDRITDQAALLYRVRDEILNTTEEGQRYKGLYYEHSAEIAAIMISHPEIDEQGLDVIDAFTPNLQALLDGQGGTVTITTEQVQQAQAFLDVILPYASPRLQEAILNERELQPLEQLSGMTMAEAWEEINSIATPTPTNTLTSTATLTSTPTATPTNTPTSTATHILHSFSGFFAPVDNQPTLNVVKAGSGVPIKFSLNGYQGLNIFANGYPASTTVTCGSAVEGAIEQTVTAGASSLSYDAAADQYVYTWKTDKAWVDTCRILIIKLDNGTYHRANFKFK